MSNAGHLAGPAAWLNFRRIICERWSSGNLILLGDAAHTAHFSIGSGTKLALEDAIKLAEVLNRPGLSREAALAEYQAERNLEVLKLQNSARNSTEWFETLDRYLHFEPIQFAYSLLTRSQRVSHENLRLRDRDWLEGVERWFWEGAGVPDKPAPPMFAPFRLRDMQLANRVVVSPMAMYSAEDGVPNDFHFVHYGARAQGGAGPRLHRDDLRLARRPDQPRLHRHVRRACRGVEADRRFRPRQLEAKFCLQLGHSGRRARPGSAGKAMTCRWTTATGRSWRRPTCPGRRDNQVPRPMTRADMDAVRDQFVAAVRMGLEAGFDMIELHAAHGYLLSSFITPLQNKRTDEYGGSLENRLRFPLEVFAAMRAAWPADRPMSVRISANDWMGEDGVTPDEAVRSATPSRARAPT